MTTTVPAHRTRAVVQPDGKLIVSDLPFKAGENVDVIVIAVSAPGVAAADEVQERLRGTVVKDEHPFEPAVPADDWDALR